MTGVVDISNVVLALDVDGVLVDPLRAGAGAGPWTTALSARYGVDPSGLEAFFRGAWSEVIVGACPIEVALGNALRDLAWDIGVDDFLACWFEADFVLHDHVVVAVRDWTDRGAQLALVTNQEHRRATFLHDRLGALLPISTVVYSGRLGVTKPAAEFFELADGHLRQGPPARSVVFVDDILDNVDAARRHGWLGVHFTDGPNWRHEIDDAITLASPDLKSRTNSGD